jgi:hypothetical protein
MKDAEDAVRLVLVDHLPTGQSAGGTMAAFKITTRPKPVKMSLTYAFNEFNCVDERSNGAAMMASFPVRMNRASLTIATIKKLPIRSAEHGPARTRPQQG